MSYQCHCSLLYLKRLNRRSPTQLYSTRVTQQSTRLTPFLWVCCRRHVCTDSSTIFGWANRQILFLNVKTNWCLWLFLFWALSLNYRSRTISTRSDSCYICRSLKIPFSANATSYFHKSRIAFKKLHKIDVCRLRLNNFLKLINKRT